MIVALWKVVSGLLVFSMLNFAVFLKLIHREYWTTFFSTITGKQYVVKNYYKTESDQIRFDVFTHHRSFYDNIQGDIIKWLNDSWSEWEETSPGWFTAGAVASIPADMLPVAVLQEMGGAKGRRESIDAMKKEKAEELKSGSKRKQSVRGADLKIIQDLVGEEEGEEER